MYETEDQYRQECSHKDWVKMCIYCGAILEDSENKSTNVTGANNQYVEVVIGDDEDSDRPGDGKEVK